MLIKDLVNQLNIHSIIHFTNVNNLISIINHGMISRDNLISDSIPSYFSDNFRYDGKTDTISLSINCPNFFMLSKKEQGMYCILKISKDILWEKNCAFFPHNAASREYRYQPFENFMGANNLAQLFHHNISVETSQGIKTFYRSHDTPIWQPTSIQAEILCKDSIESHYIDEIILADHFQYNWAIQNIPQSWHKKLSVLEYYFGTQQDFTQKYKPTNIFDKSPFGSEASTPPFSNTKDDQNYDITHSINTLPRHEQIVLQSLDDKSKTIKQQDVSNNDVSLLDKTVDTPKPSGISETRNAKKQEQLPNRKNHGKSNAARLFEGLFAAATMSIIVGQFLTWWLSPLVFIVSFFYFVKDNA